MSKIKPKYIDIGTGTNQLKDATLPSIVTPTNYTPTPVGSEGSNKISAHLNGINNKLGTVGAGDVVGPTGDANTDNRLAIFDGATGKLLKKNQDIKVNSNTQVLASNFIPGLVLSSATGTNAVLSVGPKNYFLNNAGLVSISGFNSGNSNGTEVSITNSLTTPVTLLNNSGPASDKLVVGGTDLILNPGETVNFIKNGTYNLVKAIGTSNSSGSGSKNYLGTVNNVNGNGNFELGTTAKWSLFTTTLTSGIPTGSITAGAASITSFAAVTSNKLAGDYSLQIGATSLVAGQGFISDAFTLDAEDRAKAMAFSYYYQLTAGVAAGNSTNTFAVYLYDVANSQWVQPSGVFGMGTLTGIAQNSGQFQTSANATSYRLAVVCINSFGSSITARFDDFTCGPSQYVYGSPVTDWTPFTPTGSWTTNTTYTGLKRVVGSNIEYQVRISLTGTPNATNLAINIPDTINTAMITSGLPNVGTWSGSRASYYNGAVSVLNTTSVFLLYNGNNNQVNATIPATWANGDQLTATFSVPIVGKSSSIQMSDSSGDGRIVGATAQKGATVQSIPNNTITVVTNYNTVRFDKTGSFNPVTGIYTVPVSGLYRASGSVGYAAGAAGGVIGAVITVNSSTRSIQTILAAASQIVNCTTSVSLQLVAGDKVNLGAFQTSGSALNTHIDENYTTFSIERISGPTAIAASETVACRYFSSAGQSIPNNAFTTLLFASKSFDTHNAMNTSTGIYTCPIAGIYEVSSMALTSALAFAAGDLVTTIILKNGIEYCRQSYHRIEAGITTNQLMGGTPTQVQCVAGDTLAIQAFIIRGGATALDTASNYNWVNIKRVGM